MNDVTKQTIRYLNEEIGSHERKIREARKTLRMLERAPEHCHYCEHWSTSQVTGRRFQQYRSWCNHYDQHAQYVQDRCIEEGSKS